MSVFLKCLFLSKRWYRDIRYDDDDNNDNDDVDDKGNIVYYKVLFKYRCGSWILGTCLGIYCLFFRSGLFILLFFVFIIFRSKVWKRFKYMYLGI